MTDEPTRPASDTDAADPAPTPDASWTGTDGPPPAAARIDVPAGGTVPEGWYESVRKPGLSARARAVVSRRVPILIAALALLVGLGVGGGTAFALSDGHGDGRSAVDGRGAQGGSDGDGRSGR